MAILIMCVLNASRREHQSHSFAQARPGGGEEKDKTPANMYDNKLYFVVIS